MCARHGREDEGQILRCFWHFERKIALFCRSIAAFGFSRVYSDTSCHFKNSYRIIYLKIFHNCLVCNGPWTQTAGRLGHQLLRYLRQLQGHRLGLRTLQHVALGRRDGSTISPSFFRAKAVFLSFWHGTKKKGVMFSRKIICGTLGFQVPGVDWSILVEGKIRDPHFWFIGRRRFCWADIRIIRHTQDLWSDSDKDHDSQILCLFIDCSVVFGLFAT